MTDNNTSDPLFPPSPPRRALVLSGGGAKGAWQAGVIARLYGQGKSYDGIFGVSVGAINGLHLAQYKRGQEYRAAKKLHDLWFQLDNSKVKRYRNRLFGPIAALWSNSIYSTAPLRRFLDEHLDVQALADSGKHFSVGTTNYFDGRSFRSLGIVSAPFGLALEGGKKDVLDAVMASAAFPLMFEPIVRRAGNMEDYIYDGGVVDVTPLKQAITWGADEVDVILCEPSELPTWDCTKRKVPAIGVRTLDIMMHEIIENDLKVCRLYNESVVKGMAIFGQRTRRFVNVTVHRPKDHLDIDSLDFDPDKIVKCFMQGMLESNEYMLG